MFHIEQMMKASMPNKLPKSQSKEAYRLWFEFLRRAIAEDKSKVKLSVYKEWGDVASYKSFDAWWREVGTHVINSRPSKIEHVDKGASDSATYLLRVPKSMTSTQIGNEVRKYLMDIGHQPVRTSALMVTEGKEIRPQTYRIYLNTYDEQKKLEDQSGGKRVTANQLILAVIKLYKDREQRHKNTKRKFDKLPPSLILKMKDHAPNEIDVLASNVPLNAIKRYLREANKIIEAVKQGRFPE